MNRIASLLTVLAAAACFYTIMPSAEAQIAMDADVTQRNYLLYEPVYLKVSMRNLTGHPLAFGENKKLRGQLSFQIVPEDGSGAYAALSKGEYPTTKGIILQPGVVRSFTYNVSAFYKLQKPGRYSIKAVISHPQLKSAYESQQRNFSITNGIDVWTSVVGLPDASLKDDQKIQTRRYTVKSYHTGRSSVLSLIIDDDRKVYFHRRIGFNLGGLLQPKCAIDDMSRLNIIIAASQKVFAYYLFSPYGRLEKKEIRVKTDTTPTLTVNKDLGTVLLTGGRKANKDKDYEELKDLPFIKEALDDDMKDITGGRPLISDENED